MGSKTRAFTLTEIAIVLGVMGIVLAGIWTAAAQVIFSQGVATTTKQVLTISYEVRNLYANKAGFSKNSSYRTLNSALIAAGVIPKEMLDTSGTIIRHNWGGTVSVDVDANQTNYFWVTLFDVSVKVCSAISTKLSSSFGLLTAPQAIYFKPLTGAYTYINNTANANLEGISAACKAAQDHMNIGFQFILKS